MGCSSGKESETKQPGTKKKVLVFGASLSANSINQKFAEYVGSRLQGVQTTVIKLADYAGDIAIFSPEELKKGVPDKVVQFGKLLDQHDGVVVSLAEYNFSYTAAFKNLIDWLSREKNEDNYYLKTFRGKSFFILKATPAPDYGAPGPAKHAVQWFPVIGAKVVASYTQHEFYQKFVDGKFTDDTQNQAFEDALAKFQAALN